MIVTLGCRILHKSLSVSENIHYSEAVPVKYHICCSHPNNLEYTIMQIVEYIPIFPKLQNGSIAMMLLNLVIQPKTMQPPLRILRADNFRFMCNIFYPA